MKPIMKPIDEFPESIIRKMVDDKIVCAGLKYDYMKQRWDLLPMSAINEVVKVMNYGATKYDDHNWKKGIQYSRSYSATMRHLYSWWQDKESEDSETGISHLAHAICNLLFLLHFELEGEKHLDDR